MFLEKRNTSHQYISFKLKGKGRGGAKIFWSSKIENPFEFECRYSILSTLFTETCQEFTNSQIIANSLLNT